MPMLAMCLPILPSKLDKWKAMMEQVNANCHIQSGSMAVF